MVSLMQEYDRVVNRIISAWEKGVDNFREIWAQGELPDLLEKAREMPVPKEPNCKSAQKIFQKGIEARIKGREVSVKYTDKGIPDRIWKPQVAFWLSASESVLKDMVKDFVSVRKKYQV